MNPNTTNKILRATADYEHVITVATALLATNSERRHWYTNDDEVLERIRDAAYGCLQSDYPHHPDLDDLYPPTKTVPEMVAKVLADLWREAEAALAESRRRRFNEAITTVFDAAFPEPAAPPKAPRKPKAPKVSRKKKRDKRARKAAKVRERVG